MHSLWHPALCRSAEGTHSVVPIGAYNAFLLLLTLRGAVGLSLTLTLSLSSDNPHVNQVDYNEFMSGIQSMGVTLLAPLHYPCMHGIHPASDFPMLCLTLTTPPIPKLG